MPEEGACGLEQTKMPEAEALCKKTLHKHMIPGCAIRVFGSINTTGDMPSINFDFPDGIALQVVFKFAEGVVSRNTYVDGEWGPEETDGGMPLQRGEQFNIEILSTAEDFQIRINGELFTTYRHRIDNKLISGIRIAGPLHLQKVLYVTPPLHTSA